jgi:lipopolysaccharide export system protein LptA
MPVLRLIRTALLCLAAATGTAWAAKADRTRPLVIDAGDGAIVGDKSPGRVEVQGPVLVSKGSLLMRAARLVATDVGGGYRVQALAAEGGAVQIGMDLEQPGTRMEAQAEQVDYEEVSGLLRLTGNARLRQLAGGQMQRELTGNQIVFDTVKEAVLADGKPQAGKPGEGGLRMILMPPAAASAAAAASGVPLQVAPALAPKPPSK